MKTSKAHYVMTANIMRLAGLDALRAEVTTQAQTGQIELVRTIAQNFAAEFARTNAAFDRSRFIKACELPAIPGSIRAQVNKAIEPGADYDPTCIFCQNGEEPGHDH